ncbi:MAG: dihydrofolate reductase family protein [Myxococcales bacterium]
MRKLKVFNNVSLDGYFCDRHGDMNWAHERQDAEFGDWVSSNASGASQLLFGRVTYEMMASFWPTPMAMETLPTVAKGMNSASKVVFSRSLSKASWQNTRLIKGDLLEAVQALKAEPGPDLVLMGSGSIVAQLAQARLIDTYQLVVHPTVLGAGRTLFQGIEERLCLTLSSSRAFKNGNLVLWYEQTR